MLAAAETVETVSRQVQKHKARALVVDPVRNLLSALCSSNGGR